MSRNYELMQRADEDSKLAQQARQTTAIETARPRRMLQGPQQSTEEVTDWLRLWNVLRKRWRLSATFGAVVVIATMLFTFLTQPIYEPSVRIQVDPPGAELFSMEGGDRGITNTEYLETQAKDLESDELAVGVIRKMRLDQNPEFTGRGILSTLVGPVFGGIQRIPSLLWQKPHGASRLEADALRLTAPEAKALAVFQDRLTIQRDTTSRFITLRFATHDPVLSANIANTVVNEFVDRSFETRHQAIMKSTAWLSRQLDDVRSRMEQAARALADFQSVTGIADVDANRSTFNEQVGELSRQKTMAQTERIQLDSYLSRAKAGNLETLPQIQSNIVIQSLTQKLAETRAELSQNLAVYGKNHPNTKRLQNQVDELQAQIRLQETAVVGQLRTSYNAALAREEMLDDELKGTAKSIGQMSRYGDLKKEAEVTAGLYNALYAKVKEAGITAASKSSNIRIVDHARVLDTPTRPRPLVNLAASLLVAIVGGVLLAFVREALDTRIHTAEDVKRWTGISAISILPLLETKGSLDRSTSAKKLLSMRDGLSLRVPPKFMKDSPQSIQAEAMRGLSTSIMLSKRERPPQVLLVASSLPTEGKSTVAVNLALNLAQRGTTCLMDADLRRPTLVRTFNLRAVVGLGEHLGDSTPLESVLVPVPEIHNLTLLPAGRSGGDPGQLIASAKMQAVVAALRERYDFLIIDSPPILPYADGRALAPFVDGVVFVGRAGVVTREAMIRSMELLEEVHSAPILDIVLNAAELGDTEYRYYQKYDRKQSA